MQTNDSSLNRLDGLGIFTLLARALTPPANVSGGTGRRGTAARRASGSPLARRRGVLERIDHWLWARQQRDRETYLAKATDIHDLELRIRALERNPSSLYY